MTNPLPISAFIITLNEADRIERAIASLRPLVSEIIVIDSGSGDGTQALATQMGARVLHRDWSGYGAQKRFGEDQCRHRWLINLDADEEITPALVQEIRALFAAGEPEMAGYVLRVRDLLPGEEKLAPMAHTNYVLRLYNKEKARFSESPVHDSVIVHAGGTHMLTQPVLHRSFRSLTHALDKMNTYTSMQADNLRRKGVKCAGIRLLVEFPFAFFKNYILRGYILRGRRGFVNSVMYAFGRFIRLAKYLELRDKQ